MKCCFAVTTLDLAGSNRTVSCQLAAISSQMCILDSPGGFLTLDLALSGWLRKFHKRIGPFVLFAKPRCEAFLSALCIFGCLFVPFLFHFLRNTRFHVTEGTSKPRSYQSCPHASRWIPIRWSLVCFKKKKKACVVYG